MCEVLWSVLPFLWPVFPLPLESQVPSFPTSLQISLVLLFSLALSNPLSHPLTPFRGVSPPACDVETDSSTRWRLEYDVYQYFLPESDLSELSLIRGIQRVASVSAMVENGRKVPAFSDSWNYCQHWYFSIYSDIMVVPFRIWILFGWIYILFQYSCKDRNRQM